MAVIIMSCYFSFTHPGEPSLLGLLLRLAQPPFESHKRCTQHVVVNLKFWAELYNKLPLLTKTPYTSNIFCFINVLCFDSKYYIICSVWLKCTVTVCFTVRQSCATRWCFIRIITSKMPFSIANESDSVVLMEP